MAVSARRLNPDSGLVQTPNAPSMPNTAVKVTDEELGLPETILKAALGFKDITVDIPMNATLLQVEDTLSLAITGYNKLRDASERLKPVIGRILLTVQDRKLFRPVYKNFTDYVMRKVVADMGFGRSNAFDSLKIARAFPHLTLEQYQNYGATRLLLAARVTNETDPDHMAFLDKSTQQTVDLMEQEVKGIAADQRSSTREPSTTITMRVKPETREEWDAMVEASGLQPNDLLVACMAAMRALPKEQQAATPVVAPATAVGPKVRRR